MKSICRTETRDSLMRAPVIVIAHVIGQTLPGIYMSIETDFTEAFAFDGLKEPFDFSLGLRTVRITDNMFDLVFIEIFLKQRLSIAPAIEFGTLVGQQFSRLPMTDTGIVQYTITVSPR